LLEQVLVLQRDRFGAQLTLDHGRTRHEGTKLREHGVRHAKIPLRPAARATERADWKVLPRFSRAKRFYFPQRFRTRSDVTICPGSCLEQGCGTKFALIWG